MNGQFIPPVTTAPKKGGKGMIILVVLCLCCSFISSSLSGAYYTGNIPNTFPYVFNKSNQLFNKMNGENRCVYSQEEETLVGSLNGDLIDSFVGINKLMEYHKNNSVVDNALENYKLLREKCGDTNIEVPELMTMFMIWKTLGLVA